MALQVLFTGIAALAVILCIWYLAGRIRPVPDPIVFSDPASCRKILACEGCSGTEAQKLYSAIKSRAIPNQRLIEAFGIDNSFTTMEGKRRKEFNSKAGQAIKMTEDKVSTTVLFSPKKLVWARPKHQDLPFPLNFIGKTSYLAVVKAMLTSTSCSGKMLQTSQRSSSARLYPLPTRQLLANQLLSL